MTPVRKKKRKSCRLRWVALPIGILLLSALVVFLCRMNSEKLPEPERTVKSGLLVSCENENVAQVTVSMKNGETWTVEQPDADGKLYLAGVRNWTVDQSFSGHILEAAANLTYESVLTENPEDYRDHLDAFGLSEPKLVAEFVYRDASRITIRVGEQSALSDETYYFMLVDGDDRLFSVDAGTLDFLYIEKALLRPVVQPDIQSARLDRISVIGTNKKITWELKGNITDSDALENWFITEPFIYPADADTIASLKKNADNLRLGVYIDEADPERLADYGLDQPEQILLLHMAEGVTGTINENYEYITEEKDESEIRLEIGKSKNDMVDYVRYGDAIYTMNHFLLSVFSDAEPIESAARYPVLISTDQLSKVQVTRNGKTDVYELFRDEAFSEDQAPETICKKNGLPIDAKAFMAAWERMLVVTVSGKLPEGWESNETPHTVYEMESVSGKKHRIAFVTFDALHDAVFVDGYALFYLIRDGMPELN